MNVLTTVFNAIASFILMISPSLTFTEGVVGQPQSFLPSQAQSQTDKTISKLIFRGLFKYDIYGIIQPDLAESWTISDEGKTYTIKLKDNQYWSNGKKITSDDLIYTSFKVDNLKAVSTDKVDELTVRYSLPNKFSPFLSLLTTGVMPSDSEEKADALQPVTSGDFKIVGIERSGPIIKTVDLFNTNNSVKYKKLIFKYYPNENEIQTAAKLGEVDGFISSAKFKLDNFKEYKFPIQSVYYALFFNLSNEKLKDVEVRKNLQKVLPVEDIIFNDGITVEGPISRSIYTDKNLKFDNYNKTFSSTLNFTDLTITIPDIDAQETIAEKIKSYWEDKLKINVKIIKKNPKDLLEAINNRDFEVLLYGQEVGRDPDRYVYWHSTQKVAPGLNLPGFEQVRADRALEEGRNVTDEAARMIHYNEFQKVINDQVPAIFLYHPYAKYYVSKYVEGIGEKYTFTSGDRFLDFNNWKKILTN